jgi:threonine dehydratase
VTYDWPTLADIQTAARRLAGSIMNTPCVPSKTLSQLSGCELFLKFENLQFTASFKERGALNKLLQLGAAERRAGVCAMSAGNHAQGVAYHAHRLGIPAVIYMPIGTPLTKISRTRDHGAEVVIAGANLSEALTLAVARADADGLAFIHPFDDLEVICGQGTLGLELLDAVPDVDTLVVPIGGGGLISGIALAAKRLRPAIEIIGVQTNVYPSMVRALAGEELPCPDGLTIAEGIAVKQAGQITRRIVKSFVDDIVLVSEEAIERAIALMLSVEKTVVEGAGATGLAAILEHRARFAGKKVATLLCGGNIDLRVLASVATRELVRNGQLMRFDVPISDQPGALSALATVLAREGANIVDIAHDRLSLALNPKRATIDLVVEVQDRHHGEMLLAALPEAGFVVTLRSI